MNEIRGGWSHYGFENNTLVTWSKHWQAPRITNGYPRITFNGFSINANSNAPRHRDQKVTQLRDDFTSSYEAKGHHDVKAGFEFVRHFEDSENGGFYFTAHDHETLIHRPKPTADEAMPPANGVLARVLHNAVVEVRAREALAASRITALRADIRASGETAVLSDDDLAEFGILTPGVVIGGRFEIVRLIGRGGWATVYEANDRELGERVALKLLRPETAAKARDAIDRLREEIAAVRFSEASIAHEQPLTRVRE